MTSRKAVVIGPFSRGLNTYDDPTALHDQECAEALNFDPGLDGSLRSRPPFTDTGDPLPVTGTGTPMLLGYYYSTTGEPYLIASDGDSSTWSYFEGEWTLITSTFSASDMAQFDGKAWLVSPVGETDPGGYWTPSGGFTADADMPRGASITSYKSRLWIAQGMGGSNPTRVFYSKVIGQPDFWAATKFLDVGSGDGQNIVKLVTYYDTMLVFRTKSIWSFQYSQDPAAAIQGVIVPGVGLQSRHALVAYENYLYFMYDERAYSFINNRAEQINIKVPFKTSNPTSTSNPFTVSLFNNRVLYSYYENVYVYSLRTKTWTMWRSDTWGPIGQLMMPATEDLTGVAYGVPSASVPPRATLARNRCRNPSFEVDLSYWGASTGSPTLSRVSTVDVGHDHVCEVTTTGTGFSQVRLENTKVTPGENLSFLLAVKIPSGTSDVQVGMNCVQGGTEGTVSGTIIPAPTAPPGEDWQTMPAVTVTSVDGWVVIKTPSWEVLPDTDFVRLYVRLSGLPLGAKAQIDTVRMDNTPADGGELDEYLDGDTVSGDPDIVYAWDGTDGLSSSVKYTFSGVSLLRIRDEVTNDSEDMSCVFVSKNYNFDVPGSFKVLFWWGIDAIFKTNVQGLVIPGVYNLSTTWGRFMSDGISWGSLLGGTWTHPYLSDPSIVSDVTTSPGPVRKFVKFFKKLRFRQIQFRVTFRIDGSKDTSPVQLFTLSTYMSEKQTVTKTVS